MNSRIIMIKEGWIYNNNYIPGKRIYLDVTINKISQGVTDVSVHLNEKIKTSFKVKSSEVY